MGGGDRGEGRGFREVDIAITSVVPGNARFTSDEDRDCPMPSLWRNNLTALSKEYNLYFVAHGDQIHAYQPEFPSQRITKTCFRWTVAGSGRGRLGVFPSWQSHWINRVVIEHLGCEEVIATVHDDGDFIVCTVRSVRDAIDVALNEGFSQDKASAWIKYLYKENVGASAWGIALHQNARLLAASSNAKQITVFAPALSRTGTWHPSLDAADRSRDLRLILSGHQANIPAIAFCNSSADPQGRYLVSTDVFGEVIIWDIWKRCTIKQVTMAKSMPITLDDECPGWSVTCLDAKAFQSVDNDLELLGYKRGDHPGANADASHARESLRDFQIPRPSHMSRFGERLRSISRRNTEDDLVMFGEWDIEEELDEDDLDGNQLEDDVDEEVWEDSEADEFLPRYRLQDLVLGDDFEDADDWGIDSDETTDVFYDTVDFGPQPAIDATLNTDDFLQGRSESSRSVRPPSVRQPRFAPQSYLARSSITIPPPAPQPPEMTLPFSILHTGQHNATLLRPPFCRYAARAIDPCCEHRSRVPDALTIYERLNLTVHIPELSIMVLASQRGRAAIFSLTERKPTGSSRCSRDLSPRRIGAKRRSAGSRTSTPNEDEDEPFALRLDWVVPFKSQQAQDERPWTPLIGIAASPIQYGGRGLDPISDIYRGARSRRWRLMLTYHDNSVLSYELSRGGGREESVLVF